MPNCCSIWKNNKTEYEELVLLCHSKMVLPSTACDALAAIFAIPPNTGVDRMRVAVILLGEVPGFGSLAVKNTLEGTIAHEIFRPTLEEFKSYPNGQGAGKFWSSTGLNRETAVTAVKTLFGGIGIVDIATKDACFQATVSELKFDTECIDERLMQYWACCQGRVLKTHESNLRTAEEPASYNLWPTWRIIAHINETVRKRAANGCASLVL